MLAYLRNDAARFGHEKELSRDAAFALAKQAAARAIDFDPKDTDALQAMSHVEQYAGDKCGPSGIAPMCGFHPREKPPLAYGYPRIKGTKPGQLSGIVSASSNQGHSGTSGNQWVLNPSVSRIWYPAPVTGPGQNA
ncbi:hypothetical protein [uncultured Ruegeria sp.]|uniref:hypothetical protein n=1 Tax=uncultured Ruegeria sp. TaxID=259304 RepID=UPI00263236C6|nr:hypothetical protein [uncultured Ruegeria sp.]